MLSQEAFARGGFVETVDPYAFVARFLARDDRDAAAGEPERVRQERDERLVRGPFDRRRREANQNSIAPQAVDAAAGRTGNDANVERGRANCWPPWGRPQRACPAGADGGAAAFRRAASGPSPERTRARGRVPESSTRGSPQRRGGAASAR